MESVLFVLLLFAVDRNPALKESVRDFLRFYRENRDLFGALSRPQEKSRPEEGVGDVLEAYLKRMV